METVIILKEVAKVLLFVGAFGLCVIVAIGLVKLFPYLLRVVGNLATAAEAMSKIGGDFAGVSADVAGDVRKTAASTAEGAERLADVAGAMSKISGDFASVSADVAGDVRKTVASTAAGAEHLAATAEAMSKISGDFAVVSADVAGDVRKAAASTAVGAERLVDAAEAASKIGGDFAGVSADVAGDVRKAVASTAEGAGAFAETGRNVVESSVHLRTAMQLLELLGPAGRVANLANTGISRIPGALLNTWQRVRRPNS